MTLKIDKSGRVVLPNALRDRMALEPGTNLELIETAAGLLLKNASSKPPWSAKAASWSTLIDFLLPSIGVGSSMPDAVTATDDC